MGDFAGTVLADKGYPPLQHWRNRPKHRTSFCPNVDLLTGMDARMDHPHLESRPTAASGLSGLITSPIKRLSAAVSVLNSSIGRASATSWLTGCWLGAVVCIAWQQFDLTFGSTDIFPFAAAVAWIAAIWIGLSVSTRLATRSTVTGQLLTIGLSLLSVAFPLWLDQLSDLWGLVTIEQLAGRLTRWGLMSITTALTLFPIALFASLIAVRRTLVSAAAPINYSSWPGLQFACLCTGCASGIYSTTWILGPMFGLNIATAGLATCAVTCSFVAAWLSKQESNAVDRLTARNDAGFTPAPSLTIDASFRQLATVIAGAIPLGLSTSAITQLLADSQISTTLFRLIDPATLLFVFGLVWSALCLAPQKFKRPLQSLDPSTMLALGLAVCCGMIWTQWGLAYLTTDAELWINSNLTTGWSIWSAKQTLRGIVLFPAGAGLAVLVYLSSQTNVLASLRLMGANDHQTAQPAWNSNSLWHAVLGFSLGLLISLALRHGAATASGQLLLAGTLASVSVAAAALTTRGTTTAGNRWRLAAASLAMPVIAGFCPNSFDAAQSGKVLFSTRGVIAHQQGWRRATLPFLDDGRQIATGLSQSGTSSLWIQRRAELTMRTAGLPRTRVSLDSQVCPQNMADVLTAVIPLTIVSQPENVLVLGANSLTPVLSAVEFPIKKLVCAEGDMPAFKLLTQEVARRTGFDLSSDDRVEVIPCASELLAQSQSTGFDVILSTPILAVSSAGCPAFTVEHYQNITRHLSDRGVFCQRLEFVDYGAQTLQSVVATCQLVFAEVQLIACAPGDYLLVATNSSEGLIRPEFTQRLQSSQAKRCLARTGWDWTLPLNLPAFDQHALQEVAADNAAVTTAKKINSTRNGWLSQMIPFDTVRWGEKQREVAQLFTKKRESEPFYPVTLPPAEKTQQPNDEQLTDADERPMYPAARPVHRRQGRLIEWIGEAGQDAGLVRRLGETVIMQNIVADNPETWWWEYRKALKKQMQSAPVAKVQQVSFTADGLSAGVQPDDEFRQAYLEALGTAVSASTPSRKVAKALDDCGEPYDPLITLFLHHEAAEVYSRLRPQASHEELRHRLHTIYFAPTTDRSVRNVNEALGLVTKEPASCADVYTRWDTINSLLDILTSRWERKSNGGIKSARVTLQDVESSLKIAEAAFAVLESNAAAAGLSTAAWNARSEVLQQTLLRPLRSYRLTLQETVRTSEAKTRHILQNRQ
jgi:hypothetical protein